MAVTRKQNANRRSARPAHFEFATPTRIDDTISPNGVLLMECLLKGLCDKANEQLLLQRYLKLKARYFNLNAKQLLADFLKVNKAFEKSMDDLLTTSYNCETHRELIHIIKLFIAGELDALHAANLFDRFYLRHKPMAWRRFAVRRYRFLNKFIDGFKTNCMKDLLQENAATMPYQNAVQKIKGTEDAQYQSLFAPKVTLMSHQQTKPSMSKSEQQRHSLFQSTHTVTVSG